MRKIIVIVGLAATVALPADASALRYASPGGVSTGPCATPATACSLETAVEGDGVDDPVNGEEVIVLPGAYTQTSDLQTGILNLNIHGAAGQPTPVINASGIGRTSVLTGSISDLRFESSTITETVNLSAGSANRIFIRSSSNGSQPACQCYGQQLRNSAIVATGTAPALGISSNGGSATMTYRNVTAYSANAASPALRVQQLGMSGILNFNAFNLIAYNAAGGTDIVADGPDAYVTLTNSNYRSTVLDDSGVIVDETGTPPHQTATPLFTNAAAADLSQLPGSPTVDAGLFDLQNGDSDLAGKPRTAGVTTDIGAYEFQPPAPPGNPGKAKKCKKKKKGKKNAAAAKKKKKGCKKKRKKKR